MVEPAIVKKLITTRKSEKVEEKMEKNLRILKLQFTDVAESGKYIVDELGTHQQKIEKGASQWSDDNNTINVFAAVAGDLHALPPEPLESPDRYVFTAKVWEPYDSSAQLSFPTTDENDRGVTEWPLEVKWDEESSLVESPPEEVSLESLLSMELEPTATAMRAKTKEKDEGILLTIKTRSYENRKKKGGVKLELQKVGYLVDLMGQIEISISWAHGGIKYHTPSLLNLLGEILTLETWSGALKVLDKMTVRGSGARIVRFTGSSNLRNCPDFDCLHASTLILESKIRTLCGAICFMTWRQDVEKVSQDETTAVCPTRFVEGAGGMLPRDFSLDWPSNFAFSGIVEEVAIRISIQDCKRLIDFMVVGRLRALRS